jgi:hypothetical protein
MSRSSTNKTFEPLPVPVIERLELPQSTFQLPEETLRMEKCQEPTKVDKVEVEKSGKQPIEQNKFWNAAYMKRLQSLQLEQQ